MFFWNTSTTPVMKTNAYRTKRKVRNEANAKDADKLIESYIDDNTTYNQKTRRILEEYLDTKQQPISED